MRRLSAHDLFGMGYERLGAPYRLFEPPPCELGEAVLCLVLEAKEALELLRGVGAARRNLAQQFDGVAMVLRAVGAAECPAAGCVGCRDACEHGGRDRGLDLRGRRRAARELRELQLGSCVSQPDSRLALAAGRCA